MAFTGKSGSLVIANGGGRMDDVHRGYAQFDGNSATAELPVPLSKIRPGSMVCCMPGEGGTYENVFIDEDIDSNGEITVDSDGEITIKRAATGVSDQGFWFCLIGASA